MTVERASESLPELNEFGTFLETEGIELVRLEVPDIDGTLRGKTISARKFRNSWKRGVGISNILLGYDISDVPYEPSDSNTGFLPTWNLGPYGDVYLVPDMSTLRLVPWHPRTATVVCDMVWSDGELIANAPRTALRTAIEKTASHNLTATCALEYEFLLFQETSRSLREKRFRNLTPAFSGVHSYSHLRAEEIGDFLRDVDQTIHTLGIETEALHTEYAPGNVEITFRYSDPLQAADAAARFKLAVKTTAKRHDMVATFMARSMEGERASGMGGHLHLGVRDRAGSNALWNGENHLSDTGLHFLAGMLNTLREFSAFYGPTVNSYRRTVAHSFAPTTVSWGYENRSAAIRVLARDEASTRFEVRRPGADANPYVVIAASLAGGCFGLDRQEKPADPIAGNAYDREDVQSCPATLLEAVELLERSAIAGDYLGKDFVEHFAATRRWEWTKYTEAALGQLSDWELVRYFEMI